MGRATVVTLPAYTPPGGTAHHGSTSPRLQRPRPAPTSTDSLGTRSRLDLRHVRPADLTEPSPTPTAAGPKTAPVWKYTYYRDGGPLLDTTDPTGANTEGDLRRAGPAGHVHCD